MHGSLILQWSCKFPCQTSESHCIGTNTKYMTKHPYCFKLLSINNWHKASSLWQTLRFKFVASLMVLAQTVGPLWLLQGKGGAIDIWPLLFTGWIRFKATLYTKFVGEWLSCTTCNILSKCNNHVQIVILFRQWPWVLTSNLEKKNKCTSSLI